MRSHILSSKLRFAAVSNTRFVQFCKPEPGFGRKKGDTITIQKIKNITVPGDGTVAEDDFIPVDTFAVATTAITVTEFGRGVEYTSLAEDLGEFNLENAIQKKLRDQLGAVLDRKAAAAFKTTYVNAVPSSATGITWTADGLLTGHIAYNNLTVAHCGVIRDYMTDTLYVPFWEKQNYIGIASTRALRGIKSDPEFMEWRKYLNPGEVLYNSEVGQVEQIRFVESNDTTSLSNAAGSGALTGEAVIFGEDAVAMVEVITPELRAAIPGDFGRKKAVAWYGVLQFGLIWYQTATAGEVRVVYVTGAAS